MRSVMIMPDNTIVATVIFQEDVDINKSKA